MPTDDPIDPLSVVFLGLTKVTDPGERLRAITAVRRGMKSQVEQLDILTRFSIAQLRDQDPPATWPEIGDLLGVTAQRAHQIANPTTTPAESNATR